MVKLGSPARTSTSTVTCRGSRPSMANVVTRASMAATVPGGVCRISTALLRPCVDPARGSADRRGGDAAPCRTGAPAAHRDRDRGPACPPTRDVTSDGPASSSRSSTSSGWATRWWPATTGPRTASSTSSSPTASVLVFVEVKTRRATRATSAGAVPWDALHPGKQRQVRATAAAYLRDTADRPPAASLRFDAVGVVIDPRGRLVRLDHLEGAF